MRPTGLRLVGFTLERKNSLVMDRANAQFIAQSRTDLPLAIEEIKRLRERVAELERGLEGPTKGECA
jgi:hypothetical protein